MIKLSYLQRLKQRQQLTDLKEQIVFGLTLGWLLTLVGGFHYFFVIGTSERFWQLIFYLGILLVSLAILLPSPIALLQKPLQTVTQKIGEVLFSLILILNYFLLILPVGILLRRLQKSTSFYTWTHERLPEAGGWIDWRSQESIKTFQQGTKKRSLLLQLAWVVAYFFRGGHYLLLPVLVLLLVLSLILFFIKASALAPFIYTLF